MVVHLSPDVESALEDAARAQGVAPDDLANEALRERFVANGSGAKGKTETYFDSAASDEPAEGEGTLADFLEGYIGVLSSTGGKGGGKLSQNTGEAYARALAERRKNRAAS